MAKKPKHTKIFCVVCKTHIVVHDKKEFNNLGHYEADDEMPAHLLAPDLGRSSHRHARAMRRYLDVPTPN